MLWEKQQLGSDTPDSIINTLWFYNTVHFGLRGSDEHREMCWDDIKLCADTDGQEYLEFTERQTKTRTGLYCGSMEIFCYRLHKLMINQ